MPDNNQYSYIVGRLRALETKMLNQGLLERIIDAPSAEEAYRVLNDMPLVMANIGDFDVKSFNKVLVASLKEMKRLFIQMSPYPEHLNFLWFKYDFHNLKVVLKAKLTERGYADVEHALIDLGNVSLVNWEKYLLEDKKIELTPDISDLIIKVKSFYEKTSDPQAIDMLVDQYLLDKQMEIAEEMESPLIISYLRRLIDFSNLKAFIRAKELNRNLAYLETALLSGGYADLSVFKNSFERGYEELRQTVEKVMHADDLVIALERFTEDKHLLATEKKAHELQQEFMTQSRRISFGPEPVFAFFWKFENQLHTIRAALVGKLNNLPTEDISKHVLSL